MLYDLARLPSFFIKQDIILLIIYLEIVNAKADAGISRNKQRIIIITPVRPRRRRNDKQNQIKTMHLQSRLHVIENGGLEVVWSTAKRSLRNFSPYGKSRKPCWIKIKVLTLITRTDCFPDLLIAILIPSTSCWN